VIDQCAVSNIVVEVEEWPCWGCQVQLVVIETPTALLAFRKEIPPSPKTIVMFLAP
jgi:hypothetical protein